jgi:FKBP-type peptidyl-prolyl cis-trans isomerase
MIRSRSKSLATLGLLLLLPACRPPQDPTVRSTPVEMVVEKEGVGRPAVSGDTVTIDYRIFLENGREVLSDTEYRFILGTGSVIAGIDDAVQGMRIAGTRKIRCPPHRHWGRGQYGNGAIPADETLTIEIELDSID